MLAVLLQKPPDGRKLLVAHALLIEVFVSLEGLLGVEGQHLNFRLPLDHIQQGVDPGADAGIGQDADVGGLDDKKDQIAHAGGDAIVLDAVDPHELPGGLGGILFFLSVHSFIPPWGKLGGKKPVQRMVTQQVTRLGFWLNQYFALAFLAL